jgi:diacylglycerol kinase (ATP)
MKYLLLYNPMSGRANFKKHIDQIIRFFNKTEHSLDIYESKAPKDLEYFSFEQASNYDVFLVAGGDGTVNEVLNGIMKSEIKPILGILPAGTANDTAAILGINKNINRSLKIFMNHKPVKMDINQINNQYFIYTVSSGMLSRISYAVSRRHIKKYGYMAYVIEAMKDIAHDYRYPIFIQYDGQEVWLECIMVLGLSTNRVGGMRLYNFSHAKLNDGKLELRIFRRVKSLWRFRFLSSFIRGGKKLREDLHLSASKFLIKTNNDVNWNADGEFSTSGNVLIQTHQEAIYVYASSKSKKAFF